MDFVRSAVLLLLVVSAARADEVPVVGGGEPAHGVHDARLVHRWTLGADDLLLGRIGSIHEADDGTVFVLDRQLGEVQVIDADGTWLRAIGRAGEGPGEFREPTDMFLTHDGNVAVVQQSPSKVALIGRDGTALDDARLPDATTGFRFLLRGQATQRGFALATAMLTPSDDGSLGTKLFVEVVSATGELVSQMFGIDGGIDMAAGTIAESSVDNISLYWAVTSDDRIAGVASFDEYVIDVRALDGTRVHEIRRDVAPRPRTEEELASADEGFDMTINDQKIEMIPEPNARMIDGLVARPGGALWAMLRETAAIDGDAGRVLRVDEFGPDGEYLRQLVVRGDVSHDDRVQLRGDHAYVISEPQGEEEGEITLSCYALEIAQTP